MKSKNIDDILNEMRNRADTVIEGRTITERNFVPQETIDEWADQIESAVKHMHGLAQAHCNMLAKAVKYHKDKHIGNAAAMRKALEACMDYLWRVDHPMNDVMRGLFKTAYDKSQAALAAPPRNCDRYSHDEALSVWLAEKENGKNGYFDEWLYAPATEKEGGAE